MLEADSVHDVSQSGSAGQLSIVFVSFTLHFFETQALHVDSHSAAVTAKTAVALLATLAMHRLYSVWHDPSLRGVVVTGAAGFGAGTGGTGATGRSASVLATEAACVCD